MIVGKATPNRSLSAVICGRIDGEESSAKKTGDPKLKENRFWKNAKNVTRSEKKGAKSVDLVIDVIGKDKNREGDPGFRDPGNRDFSLAPQSPGRKESVGASAPPSLESPWPLQPEEAAIIPDTDTRDSRLWKTP